MNQIKTLLILITISLSFFGCASNYHYIEPELLDYKTNDINEGISFSYMYDVLYKVGNRKYAKHEKRNSVKLVAVKLTNNTDSTLNIAQDISFYSGDLNINPLEPTLVKNELKQGVPIYLLYMLLTPTQIYKTEPDNNGPYNSTKQESIFPIGLILGPGITIGNMATASMANRKFLDELLKYDINQELKQGETIYALVGFRDLEYDKITLKLNNK